MGYIKLGNQKIECSDENIANKINGYIGSLENELLKRQMGQPNSDSGFSLDNHLDRSYTADGWKYKNRDVAAHVAETDSAWKDTLRRNDAENERQGRGLSHKTYY